MKKKLPVFLKVTAGIVVMLCVLTFTACDRPAGSPNSVNKTPEMVLVTGGTFQMGKGMGSAAAGDVTPVHEVTVSEFYMGRTEITQEQYEAVTGSNPSKFTANPAAGETQANRPVELVSWYDAVEFCNKLSEMEGLETVYTISGRTPATGYPITMGTVTADWTRNGYRLPTEAEWEYAAKGGNQSQGYTFSGSSNIDEAAWNYSNSGNKTHEAGKKPANELGLYDMSGNVWEWCEDWYRDYSGDAQTDPRGGSSGTFRVYRGGSWSYTALPVRSADRGGSTPISRDDNLGFRVVRRP